MNGEREANSARRNLGIGLESPTPDLLRLLEDEAGLHVFVVSLPEGTGSMVRISSIGASRSC